LARDFYVKGKVDFDKIKEVVDTNDKKRFELKADTDANGNKIWLIRATQGHSLKSVSDDDLLEKLTDVSGISSCIHGTYKEPWNSIKKTGLNKMGRNHIHMSIGYPGDGQVISGMRKTCDVYIELDLEKAIQEGVPFYVSKNKVVLSPGINGVIPTKYFKKVFIRTGDTMKEVDSKEYEWQGGNTDKMMPEEESKNSEPVKQDFDYLCVLDFEATCDDKTKFDV